MVQFEETWPDPLCAVLFLWLVSISSAVNLSVYIILNLSRNLKEKKNGIKISHCKVIGHWRTSELSWSRNERALTRIRIGSHCSCLCQQNTMIGGTLWCLTFNFKALSKNKLIFGTTPSTFPWEERALFHHFPWPKKPSSQPSSPVLSSHFKQVPGHPRHPTICGLRTMCFPLTQMQPPQIISSLALLTPYQVLLCPFLISPLKPAQPSFFPSCMKVSGTGRVRRQMTLGA